ncbi:GNAT family N-acetyltransferase [Ochrobactrum sp. 3-3]|uniref:GNAT family N-acetyltransferase n=1 Tax=Ochrobactrum sp. 3-3 TaxID=1830124 RepID=UPI000DEF04F4|nr:GNAT family N-acetyltransferase [Ochrobactrum sp. 3-3]
MTITIKAASHADRSGWEKLWAENRAHFGAGDMDEAVIAGLWQRVRDPSSPMNAWLAFQAGEPVGLAHTILHPHTFSLRLVCYLEDLWVTPLHRGRGVATRLIEHLEVLGRQEGWRRLYWETAEDNAAARHLYDRVATLRPMATYQIELAN